MKKKTAAIYDRWLSTLGGGEQTVFALAEELRNWGFETTLLTHDEIDIAKAEQKMGVNLNGIKLVYLPLLPASQISQYTEDYDLFINSSHLDYFPNRAKHGYMCVFFPSQIFLTPYEYIKRAVILPSFKNLFIYPLSFHGFRYDEYKYGRIYKWLGEKSFVSFNKPFTSFSVTLFSKILAVSLIDEIRFFADKQEIIPIRKTINDHTNNITYSFRVQGKKQTMFAILLPKSYLSTNVALVSFTIKDIRFVLYNNFKRFFPKWEMRLHGGPGVTKLSDLTSYTNIFVNSHFTQHWVKKYWGLESEVLYPPVAIEHFSAAKRKKNWIVHTGRFFVTGHSKKQLDLVKSFRKLVDEKNVKDWELHLVGSVHPGEKNKQYVEQVRYYAKGYPIFLHLDAPFAELHKILAKSKIYWHATGLDEEEDKNPILFEHFGMTTVEAMAAGCVPVVIDAGGQREIVTDENGCRFRTREELIDKTYDLIQHPSILEQKSKNAKRDSLQFGRAAFSKSFKSMLVRDGILKK